jgi:hypothetical protein
MADAMADAYADALKDFFGYGIFCGTIFTI